MREKEILERWLMPDPASLDGKLQLPGIILAIGLIVESLCLLGRGPRAFLLLIGFGGVLIVAGLPLYLYLVVSGEVEGRKH